MSIDKKMAMLRAQQAVKFTTTGVATMNRIK